MTRGVDRPQAAPQAPERPGERHEAPKLAASAQAAVGKAPAARVVEIDDMALGAEAWVEPHPELVEAREASKATPITLTSVSEPLDVKETKTVEAEPWLTTADAKKWLLDEAKGYAKDVLKYAATIAATTSLISLAAKFDETADRKAMMRPGVERGSLDLMALSQAQPQAMVVQPLGRVLELRNTLGDGKGGAAVMGRTDGTIQIRLEGEAKGSQPAAGEVTLRPPAGGPTTVVPEAYSSGQDVKVEASAFTMRGPLSGGYLSPYRAKDVAVEAKEDGSYIVKTSDRALTEAELEQVKKTRAPLYLMAGLGAVVGVAALRKRKGEGEPEKAEGEAK